MIDFKNIIKLANPERMDFIITVQGNPTWDYKISALNTISLISNVQQGIEEEYVTLKELRKYIVSSEIPFELVSLRNEEDGTELINFKWKDENRELCLIYDISYD
jgi:hypothetical protein